MVYENRLTPNYAFGTLLQSAAIADTSLYSAEFATALPAGLSTGLYVPVTLQDPNTRQFEITWATGHAAAATTATVVRGREASTAQAWPAGTQWLVGPTARDVLFSVPNRAALPTDPHTGMRCYLQDELLAIERFPVCWGPPTALLRLATQQVIPDAQSTPVRFDAEEIDNAGGHNPTTNPSRYTVKLAGWYQLSGMAGWDVSSSGFRLCGFRKNGSDLSSAAGSTGSPHGVTVAAVSLAPTLIVPLLVNDYVELVARQEGATGTVSLAGSQSTAYQSFMAIRHLGGL